MKKTLVLLCLFTAACGSGSADKEKKPSEAPSGTAPKLVGRITSIPAGKEFALIQLYGGAPLPAGASLTTLGPEGRTANLYATGEKLDRYAAADIRSGTVEIGDSVFLRFSDSTPVQPAIETNSLGKPIKSKGNLDSPEVKSF